MSQKRSIIGLIPIINLLESYGHNPVQILERHHVSLDSMMGTAVIDSQLELEIVADVVQRLNEPLLGLEVGRQINFTSYGMLAMLLMTAPDLLESARIGARFQSLSLLFSHLTVNVEKDWVELRYTLPKCEGDIKNYIADRDLIGVYIFIREVLSAPEIKLLTFGTARPKPTGILLKRYFQNVDFTPTFDQPCNWMRIPMVLARQPLKNANPLVHKVYLVQAYEQMGRFFPDKDDPIAQVRQVVAGYDNNFPTLPDIAKTLGNSDRTLRRKLKEAGLSYREILDDHKKKRALDMLAQKNMSITALTESLGYTESTSFLRAFKRWTGQTPKQYIKVQNDSSE